MFVLFSYRKQTSDLKNKLSIIAISLIMVSYISLAICWHGKNWHKGNRIMTWDALGYYMYLPATFIYHDLHGIEWLKKADEKYKLSGGTLYQAMELPEGNYTNKYLGGVAVLQAPFFGIAHWYTGYTPYPRDGFSFPYQFAIFIAAMFWCCIGLIYIRKTLLFYFNDRVAALTLISLGLCSNLVQYAGIDLAMSHIYIFPLYALLIWHTHLWYRKPGLNTAFFIGWLCGMASICRPTEAISIFIPVLWAYGTKENGLGKIIRQYKTHIAILVLGGLCGLLPQLIYWKYTTGHLIFDVGSKWQFLNPWFRVIIGPEKGWLLYTPVAIGMLAGLFLMKGQVYQKAILTFCLLNIWIIIAWSDWQYGASYSTRALVQSYPVFAIPLACVWSKVRKTKVYLISGILLLALTGLNIYQLRIYNSGTGSHFSPLLHFYSGIR